jgi:hypothetical protein
MFACSSPTSIREVERRDDYAVIADSPLRIATLKVGDMLGRDPHTLLNPDYYKQATIRTDLAAAGFQEVQIERVARPAKAAVGAGGSGGHGPWLASAHGDRSGGSLSSRRDD